MSIFGGSPWPEADDVLAMKVHALVRYRGGGHTALIALDEPSPALAGTKGLHLGERTICLADGQQAWVSTRPELPKPNVVTTVLDRYVILVASDLAPEEVARLAGQVAVLSPTATGTSSPPPAPLSPARPNTGPADLAIAGKVRQENRWGSPHLIYQVTFGNRGCSAAHDVRVMVEFSPVLAGRARDANPPLSYNSLGPGQRGGYRPADACRPGYRPSRAGCYLSVRP